MTEWRCRACDETQLSLGRSVPPADLLCHGCRASRPKSAAQLLRAADVPQRFLRCTGRGEWERYFGRSFPVDAWPGSKERWLFLWGPTGTGKTSAATVLLAEHLARGGRGLWADGMSIREDLGREMESGGERVTLARLVRSPFLVLDEPFAGHVTSFTADRMLLIVRKRDQDGLPTIVTSQLGPEELVAFASEERFVTGSVAAAASRMMSGQVEELEGQDERLARAQGGGAQ